jgi:hypothetical protein
MLVTILNEIFTRVFEKAYLITKVRLELIEVIGSETSSVNRNHTPSGTYFFTTPWNTRNPRFWMDLVSLAPTFNY